MMVKNNNLIFIAEIGLNHSKDVVKTDFLLANPYVAGLCNRVTIEWE